MKTIIIDTETDGLNPTKVWCIVTKDYTTGEVREFIEEECYEQFPDYAKSVDRFVAHNGVGFEWRKVFPLLGVDVPLDAIIDTLVLSYLIKPNRRDGYGAHSLDAWGWRFKLQKPKHDDWSQFSPAMLERCRIDVEINYKLFKWLLPKLKGFSKESSRLEHEMRLYLDEQQDNGFYLDSEYAHRLYSKIYKQAQDLKDRLHNEIPPIVKRGDVVTPKKTKAGQLALAGLKPIQNWLDSQMSQEGVRHVVGGPFSTLKFQPYDPASSKQTIQVMDRYGWKPFRRTKTNKSWKVCEDNLKTLPDTAPDIAHKVPEFLTCEARWKTIKSWLDAADDRSYVHGSCISMGAYTHRAAHNNPNMANVPGLESLYGLECRECWTVEDPENYRLLGVDAKGIQLRVLAHLTGSKEYADKVVEDPHSTHLEILGIERGPYDKTTGTYPYGRQIAKRFIYAWVLGAGVRLIAQILGVSVKESKRIVNNFVQDTPGLAAFKEKLREAARAGYLELVDGRRASVPSEHLAMAVALQGNEAVIMKRAMVDWRRAYKLLELDVKPAVWVHDEVQAAVHKEHAEQAGQLLVDCIRQAGVKYDTRCPMDGEYKIGLTWKETH